MKTFTVIVFAFFAVECISGDVEAHAEHETFTKPVISGKTGHRVEPNNHVKSGQPDDEPGHTDDEPSQLKPVFTLPKEHKLPKGYKVSTAVKRGKKPGKKPGKKVNDGLPEPKLHKPHKVSTPVKRGKKHGKFGKLPDQTWNDGEGFDSSDESRSLPKLHKPHNKFPTSVKRGKKPGKKGDDGEPDDDFPVFKLPKGQKLDSPVWKEYKFPKEYVIHKHGLLPGFPQEGHKLRAKLPKNGVIPK